MDFLSRLLPYLVCYCELGSLQLYNMGILLLWYSKGVISFMALLLDNNRKIDHLAE